MALQVIGAGLGRTGTLSLKVALEQLGFGRCHHMIEAISSPERVRTWLDVASGGRPEWDAIFEGFGATVDWPSASWWRELAAHYPKAKLILTIRDADAWFDSTQKTIFSRQIFDRMPPDAPVRRMLEQTVGAMFGGNLSDRAHCIEVYKAHNRAVMAAIPPERLLVYEVSQGWGPLSAFLGRPIPDQSFPVTNNPADFQAQADRLASRG